MFTPSPRQSAIFDAALHTPRHLLVQACAGSGKTTTMVELSRLIPTSRSTLALSFNKSIADELSRRMPANVVSCTMHSLGLRAIRSVIRTVQVDDRKLKNCIDYILQPFPLDDRGRLVPDLLAACPLVMDMMLDPTQTEVIAAACERTGRSIEAPAESLPLVAGIIAEMDKMREIIDFSEMIRHPVIHGYAPPQFDFVMVDEVQDLNAAQHALLKKIVRQGGKLIAVGDRFQSIYGFRGADPESMDRLKAEWNMIELPLDVSYRCPKAVVAVAQKIVGDSIQPSPSAPDGEIVNRDKKDMPKLITEAQPGDMLLCRVNAPLVKVAFQFIRKGIKATVRGRDIGAGLSSLVRKLKAKDVPTLLEKVREWEANQSQLAMKAGKSEGAVQAIADKAETLYVLAQESATIAELLSRIDTLFSDDRHGILLSTVHKAKGLEADRVYILEPSLLPAPWAKTKESKQQETNIHYVAVTRAKRTLILQPIGWKDKKDSDA